MTWATRYTQPTQASWQGRADSPDESCFFQIIQLLDLQQAIPNNDNLSVALLGFNCDEGIRRNHGRVGAEAGPQAIREALARLPVHRRDIVCYDAGNISCNDNDLEAAQAALGEAVYLLLQNGITPIVLGGGHELAWGHYQGIEKKYPNSNLGIINIDAHFDMRQLSSDQKGNSGTSFLQIANAHNKADRRFDYSVIGIQKSANIKQLYDTAKSYEVQILSADEIQYGGKQISLDLVNHVIYYNQVIYLSLCMDVFATAYAPGVSAPQALGITPWRIIPAIRKLAESGKVIGYDIAELSPKYDIDLKTTKLAANLIYEIIHSHKVIE